MNQPSNEPHKPMIWWQNPKVKWLAYGVIAAILLSFLIWWIFYRSYVSTNDSRIAMNIIRIAPVGVGGTINKVMVEEGDLVKTGQTLVEIDNRNPEAQFLRARSKFELTKIEYNRAKNLAKSNYNSARDLDTAKTNFEIAEAELKLADLSLQNTNLKSPIDGIVIQKIAQVGNIIEPGQVAVMIADVGHSWVSANIEETNVGRIKVGQKVFIKIDEGGSLTGKVEEINAATASQFSLIPAENAAGNFTKIVQKIPVKISIDPLPSGKILRAGQSVSIKILVR